MMEKDTSGINFSVARWSRPITIEEVPITVILTTVYEGEAHIKA